MHETSAVYVLLNVTVLLLLAFSCFWPGEICLPWETLRRESIHQKQPALNCIMPFCLICLFLAFDRTKISSCLLFVLFLVMQAIYSNSSRYITVYGYL